MAHAHPLDSQFIDNDGAVRSVEEPTMFTPFDPNADVTAEDLTKAGVTDPAVRAAFLEAQERGDDEAAARILWKDTSEREKRELVLGAAYVAAVYRTGPLQAAMVFKAGLTEEQLDRTIAGVQAFVAMAEIGGEEAARQAVAMTMKLGWETLDAELGFSEKGLPNPFTASPEEREAARERADRLIAGSQDEESAA